MQTPSASNSKASVAVPKPEELPPTLCNWQWTADGKLTGKVYGKRGFKDGTLITTSVVPRSQRMHTHVVTEAGTAYLLGPRGAEHSQTTLHTR